MHHLYCLMSSDCFTRNNRKWWFRVFTCSNTQCFLKKWRWYRDRLQQQDTSCVFFNRFIKMWSNRFAWWHDIISKWFFLQTFESKFEWVGNSLYPLDNISKAICIVTKSCSHRTKIMEFWYMDRSYFCRRSMKKFRILLDEVDFLT